MTKVLLLIDDDSDDAGLFKEALDEVDPSVVFYWAKEAQSALEQLDKGEIVRPHVVFLDINMPRVNGWQFLSMFKSRPAYQTIPVIMYSTSSNTTEAERALNLGAIGFCTKPEDYTELRNMVAQVVSAWQESKSEHIMPEQDLIRALKQCKRR